MTDEPYMKYHIDDLELLESIRDQFWKSKEGDFVRRNRGGIHHEWYLGWPGETPWWDNNPGFAEKLKAITYPFDQPIINCWVKFYNTGEYSCLHTDDVKVIASSEEYKMGWTNSILIDQSPDLEGGDVVLAGDGWEQSFDQIKSRLITLRHKDIGDTIVWDDKIVHGISQIEKGYRATLIVVKKKESKNG